MAVRISYTPKLSYKGGAGKGESSNEKGQDKSESKLGGETKFVEKESSQES